MVERNLLLSYLGAAGIGLVWGWYCVMRLEAGKKIVLNTLAAILIAMGLAGFAYWQHGWVPALFLLMATGLSALFHFMWLQQLRRKYS